MKISLDWLSQYVAIPLSPSALAEVLTEIGLEVEGIETHESVPGGLKGVVIGQVVECGKHPNADRLSLTKVDIGGEEAVQIVCGAPNVAIGQKVPVATAGTTLYDADGNPFKIKKGKIRGEVSEGMICAEDELHLGSEHDGIMVLDEDAQIGMPAADYFDLQTDTIFEIALTPNRSDATSHLGVAHDLAAALKINYEHDGKVKMPSLDTWQASSHEPIVQVEVEDRAGCPRYAGVTISNISVGPSPEWMQKRLLAIGVRPINNVVDVTNYILHEWGQPLHAFDLSKIAENKILVKTLAEGAPFTTLDEVDRKLSAEDLMICDGLAQGMCIAGVFGGIKSGVTDETTEIFLESAHFNAKRIRRTSGRHLLYTDAAKVFEKGSDPNVCVQALKRAALLIAEVSGGSVSSKIVDVYPEPVVGRPITLHYANLDRLVGTSIPTDAVRDILVALNVEITAEDKDSLTVRFPTNKVDVTREADVIEEVLRIYGFNKVPLPSKMNIGMSQRSGLNANAIRERIASNLSALGFHETMSLSLVRQDLFDEIMPIPADALVRINNTSNAQLEIMRPTLLISMLENLQYNQNRQQTTIRLFEFGQSYRKEEDDYRERSHLAILLTGEDDESWIKPQARDQFDAYFQLKGVVEQVLGQLGVKRVKAEPLEDEHFDFGQYLRLGREGLARFGAVSSALLHRMDIRGPIFYAEFDWAALLRVQRVDKLSVEPISKYPSVRRDLALEVKSAIKYEEIVQVIGRGLGNNLTSIDLFDVYQDEEMKANGLKSYAISLVLSSSTGTFSDGEIDRLMRKVTGQLENRLEARLR